MITQGNDRLLFIKAGDVFLPVGCLGSNGINEQTEMLGTTTRNSEGWKTSIPQLQAFTISFEGLASPTLFQPDTDVLTFNSVLITLINQSVDFSFKITIVRSDGFTIFINKGAISDPLIVAANPSAYVLRGATISDTINALVDNLILYNTTLQVEFNNDGGKINIILNEPGTYQVTLFSVLSSGGTAQMSYELVQTVVTNPNPLISYDRLRLFKRNREKITWRIMSPELGPQFVDEGEGYITEISEVAPVNQDVTFSGVITGWGVPRVLSINFALGTNGELIEDGLGHPINPF